MHHSIKKIGIAGPALINSLKEHLQGVSPEQLELGLGGTAVNNLVNGLLKNGVNVSLYTLDRTISEPVILCGEHLTVYVGVYRPSGRQRMLDMFKQEARQIKEFILQDAPDFVNAHWSYEFALGTIWSNYPHLITFRDSATEILKLQKDPYRLIRFFLDLRVKIAGRHFSVNSLYLQKKLGSLGSKATVISNPVNETYIAKLSKKHPGSSIKIVSVLNGWNKRKNATKALLAFKQLRQHFGEDITYHIYGPGYAPGSEAEKWAIQNKCDQGVSFMGSYDHSVLMERIAQYDILLHPALEESFGNTLIEGLALGLPIVAGEKSGAVPWVLNYGKNGLLVDVTDEQAIYQALKKLVENKTLYESLSSDGISYIKKHFTSKEIAAAYLELYNKVLSTYPSPKKQAQKTYSLGHTA